MNAGNTSQPGQTKLVTCPTCGGDSVYGPSNAFRPFCSERCKNIDLGAWASEGFRMPAQDLTDDQVNGEDSLQ